MYKSLELEVLYWTLNHMDSKAFYTVKSYGKIKPICLGDLYKCFCMEIQL